MAILAQANTAVVAGLSASSLLLGYGLLWAMWRFIFSPRNEHQDSEDKARRGEH